MSRRRSLSTRRKAPVQFSPRIALKLLDAIASGRTLSDVCRDRGMPSRRTVTNWAKADPEFAEALTEARRVAAGALADSLLKRAIDLDRRGRRGKLQKGEVASFREYSATLRWFLARMDPATYGEKTSGPDRTVVIATTLNLEGVGPSPDEETYTITIPADSKPLD